MTTSRSMYLCVILGLMVCGSQSRAQPRELEDRVAQTFTYLRSLWPDIATPVWVGGSRIEFHEGQIRLGVEGVRQIVQAEESSSGGVVLDFVLAHEGWHSVQATRNADAEIARLRSTRLLECEADFMAAFAAASRRKSTGTPLTDSHSARNSLEGYIRVRPGEPQNDLYPSPEGRARTIALGWHYALNPAIFRSAGQLASLAPDAVASDVCPMVVQLNDGSLASLFVAPFQDRSDFRRVAAGNVRVRNFRNRPITVRYLLVATWDSFNGLDSPEVFQIVRDEVTVAPGTTSEMPYRIEHPETGATEVGLIRLWPMIVATGLRDQALITSSYVATDARSISYCFNRVEQVPSSTDRALFSRLATTALSAPDRFRSVRSENFDDMEGMRVYSLVGGLGVDSSDNVTVTPQGTWASITSFRSDVSERVTQEFERLKRIIISVCGDANVEERSNSSGEPVLWISNFGPGVVVSMGRNLWSVGHQGSEPASPGGIVSFMIISNEALE